MGDLGSVPESGRSPGEGNGNPLQYSCPPTKEKMRETWVQSLGQEDRLEKEMATHSSTLAWKIPWTEKPGRLQSMGSLGVGY